MTRAIHTIPPTLDDVRAAAARIHPYARRTPVLTCTTLDKMTGGSLFFKCENFQKVGAFKFRGACNAILALEDAALIHGVATHSSGNHAAAVALAARLRGTPAVVVMPSDAKAAKRAAVEGYGAEIVLCEPTQESRERSVAELLHTRGCALIHPYDDYGVIAGQATTALELLEDVPALDLILAPVGGGGMLSGTAITVAALHPHTRVIGAEPSAADDTYRSFRQGARISRPPPTTLADGLRTGVGALTFPIIQAHVADIVTTSEAAIVRAMRLVWERMKILIEPSAAVPLAAILEGACAVEGKRVGVMLTGGNVDLDDLPW